MKRASWLVVTLITVFVVGSGVFAQQFSEAPMLADLVAQGYCPLWPNVFPRNHSKLVPGFSLMPIT